MCFHGVFPSQLVDFHMVKLKFQASVPAYDSKYNHFHMQFGQFVAHDTIFTPTAVGKQSREKRKNVIVLRPEQRGRGRSDQFLMFQLPQDY